MDFVTDQVQVKLEKQSKKGYFQAIWLGCYDSSIALTLVWQRILEAIPWWTWPGNYLNEKLINGRLQTFCWALVWIDLLLKHLQ